MMTRTLSLLAATALLSACQSNRYDAPAYPQDAYGYPSPPAYPQPQTVPTANGYPDASNYQQPGSGDPTATYRAIGTEPFWNLDIGQRLTFYDPNLGTSVIEPTPVRSQGIGGDSYITPRIRVTIVNAPCNDGMSDRSYPDVVKVNVDGRDYHGCGGNIAMFSQTPGAAIPGDTYGQPSPMPVNGDGQVYEAADTSWEIEKVDGRKVPPGYRIDFGMDRLQAKLGCNDLAAEYRQEGDKVIAGPVFSTKKACTILGDENIAKRMMASPMLFTIRDKTMVLLNSAGTLELKRIRD